MVKRKNTRWDSDSEDDEAADASSNNANNTSSKITTTSTATSKEAPTTTTTTTVSGSTEQQYSSKSKNGSKLPLHSHSPLLQGCRSVYNCYERLARLDEGTYGIVWKARDLATDDIVALKQIKFDMNMSKKEGFSMAALREIGILLSLSHESIVTVKEMVVGDDFDKVFMVMEYMKCDLKDAIEKSKPRTPTLNENDDNDAKGIEITDISPFPQAEVKSMMHQILSATEHIHSRWILHRDMKTSNILVHESGKIALCDFGLARKYQLPRKKMTQTVITLWYRPPELLFGESMYGPEVDMWSIGCIFGEILQKDAIMQGQGELDQIDRIFKLIGSPNDESWPGFTSLPNASILRWKNKGPPKIFTKFPANSFSGAQTYLDSNGFDLLRGLLALDPKKRLTAQQALDHPYFSQGVEMSIPRFDFGE